MYVVFFPLGPYYFALIRFSVPFWSLTLFHHLKRESTECSRGFLCVNSKNASIIGWPNQIIWFANTTPVSRKLSCDIVVYGFQESLSRGLFKNQIKPLKPLSVIDKYFQKPCQVNLLLYFRIVLTTKVCVSHSWPSRTSAKNFFLSKKFSMIHQFSSVVDNLVE